MPNASSRIRVYPGICGSHRRQVNAYVQGISRWTFRLTRGREWERWLIVNLPYGRTTGSASWSTA